MADLEARIARLEAIEEIRRLKARYFRCVDTRNWVEFADLFTLDCAFEFAESTCLVRPGWRLFGSVLGPTGRCRHCAEAIGAVFECRSAAGAL